MIIGNEKLFLRELTENDTEVLFEIYSDKEAMKFRGSKSFETLSEVKLMLKNTIENSKTEKEFRYAIIEKSSSKLIGTFLLTPVSNQRCKIGCSIGKKHWRMGYGYEAISIMANYLENLNYKIMFGLIKKENLPSIKLIEKMKFNLIEQTEYPEFFLYEREVKN